MAQTAVEQDTDQNATSRVPLDALPASQAILIGEDEEQYHRMLDEVTRSLQPTDIIEQIWVRDVTDKWWEAIRLRRLKGSLLHLATRAGLHKVLGELVDYQTASKLVHRWFEQDEKARQRVGALLKGAGLSFDSALAQALAEKLDHIERIDRMITSAEVRRHAVLREINRHRDAVAARLARASERILEAEFAEIASGAGQRLGHDGERA